MLFQIFDVRRSKEVEFKFHNMRSTSGGTFSTTETLFESINQQLIKDCVSSQQCVSIGLDNTSTNIGIKGPITSAETL